MPETTVHLLTQHIKSFTASPLVRSTEPECFTFTTTEKATWLCTPNDPYHPLVQEVLSSEEQWYIVCYDKKILQVAAPGLAQGKAEIMSMYEMKLGKGKGLNPNLDAELQEGGIEIVEDPEWFAKEHPSRADHLTEQILVARSQGSSDVMGFVQVLRAPTDIYVGQLRVFPAYRSKGIAKKLMNFVHAKGGDKPIWLHTFGENLPAIGLYHSLGYRIERVLWQVGKPRPVPVPVANAAGNGEATAS